MSGIIYVLIAAPFLLVGGSRMKRKSGDQPPSGNTNDLIVGARVKIDSRIVGKSVEAAGLRGLPGLYLVSVRRDDMLLRAVGPEFIVNAGDVLHFTGISEKLGEVAAKYGLEPVAYELEEGESEEEDGSENGSGEPVPVLSATTSGTDLASSSRSLLQQPPSNGDHSKDTGHDSDTQEYATARNATNDENEDSVSTWPRPGQDPKNSGVHLQFKLGQPLFAHMQSDREPPTKPIHPSPSKNSLLKDLIIGQGDMEYSNGAENGRKRRRRPRPTPPPTPSPRGLANQNGAPQAAATKIVRVIVKEGSSVVGMAPKEISFRRTYRAAIIALMRNSVQIKSKIGETELKEGDVLLLQVSADSPLLQLKEPGAADPKGSPSKVKKSPSSSSVTELAKTGTLSRWRMKDPETEDNQGQEMARVESHEDIENGHDTAETSSIASITDISRDFALVQQDDSGDSREFMIAMKVAESSPIIGQTVEEAGLRGLPGLFLAAIERSAGSEEEAACMTIAAHDEKLQANDVLWFAGELESVAGLRKIPGLVPVEDKQTGKLTGSKVERKLVQAVVAQHGILVGKSVKETRFRTNYDAVIIAVHRSGERLNAQIGDVVLKAGDVLLLDAGPIFFNNHSRDPAFALVSEIKDSTPPRFHLLWIAGSAAVVMVALSVSNVLPLIVSAMLAVGVMILTGCVTQQQARTAVNWEVITTIAAAFGLSEAMEASGVSGNLANWFVSAAEASGTGEIGLVVAVYLGTVFLSFIVANNAAAALMFPIASTAALEQGMDLIKMSYVVMLAASASFASPFGYQTNLMVFGAGGYKFMDFVKFGLPMQGVQAVVSIGVLILDETQVFITWAIGAAALAAIILWGDLMVCLKKRGYSMGNKRTDVLDD
eukprot:scaffold2009_cov370-Prasinococcus_capsulatus_cf.AAC.2